MSKVFSVERKVRHGHTDPAGIVYYPRYIEMICETVEDFFGEVLAMPFGEIHIKDKVGVPTVSIDTQFINPSFCDDLLSFNLSVEKLSRSTVKFKVEAKCGDEIRLISYPTIVYVNLEPMKSKSITTEMKTILLKYFYDSNEEAS